MVSGRTPMSQGSRGGRAFGIGLVAVLGLLALAVALSAGRGPEGAPAFTARESPVGSGGPAASSATGPGTVDANVPSGAIAGGSPAPSALAAPSSPPSAVASGLPGAASPGVASTPLVVVSGFDNYALTSTTRAVLAARLAAGTLVVPCGVEGAVAEALGEIGAHGAPCVPADEVTAQLGPSSTLLALIPPALVTPRVKVVPLEGADLFGEKPAREAPYPLVVAVPPAWPAAWTAWVGSDVRVVVTTGVNCPDRGVSHETVVLGKGWNWLLNGGTATVHGDALGHPVRLDRGRCRPDRPCRGGGGPDPQRGRGRQRLRVRHDPRVRPARQRDRLLDRPPGGAADGAGRLRRGDHRGRPHHERGPGPGGRDGRPVPGQRDPADRWRAHPRRGASPRHRRCRRHHLRVRGVRCDRRLRVRHALVGRGRRAHARERQEPPWRRPARAGRR